MVVYLNWIIHLMCLLFIIIIIIIVVIIITWNNMYYFYYGMYIIGSGINWQANIRKWAAVCLQTWTRSEGAEGDWGPGGFAVWIQSNIAVIQKGSQLKDRWSDRHVQARPQLHWRSTSVSLHCSEENHPLPPRWSPQTPRFNRFND